MDFMDFRKARTITRILYVASVILVLIGFTFFSTTWICHIFYMVAIAASTLCTIVGYKYRRCPYCKAVLPVFFMPGNRCQGCGKALPSLKKNAPKK